LLFERRIEPSFVDFFGWTADRVAVDHNLITEIRLLRPWQTWLFIAAVSDKKNDAQHDDGLKTKEEEIAGLTIQAAAFAARLFSHDQHPLVMVSPSSLFCSASDSTRSVA